MKEINEHSETLWQDLCDIAQKRAWDERLTGIKGAYIRPNGLEHDSSFGCFDIIAYSRDPVTLEVVNYVRCGGTTDDISFEGPHFRMDCMYPSGVIHIWNPRQFSITEDLSSISFVEEGVI